MRLTVLALLLVAAASAPADDVDPQVSYWIGKLDDADEKVREQAADALRKLGRAALPALRRAGADAEPELRVRAESLADEIERQAPAKPQTVDVLPPPEDSRRVVPPHVRFRFPQVDAGAGRFGGGAGVFVRHFVITENGRTIRIHESSDAISVSVTDRVDGRVITKVSKARDVEALEREHPEAHELYERYAARMRIQVPRLTPGPIAPPEGLGLAELPEADRLQVERMMAEARAAMERHRALLGQHRRIVERHREAVEEMRRQAVEEVERIRRELEER